MRKIKAERDGNIAYFTELAWKHAGNNGGWIRLPDDEPEIVKEEVVENIEKEDLEESDMPSVFPEEVKAKSKDLTIKEIEEESKKLSMMDEILNFFKGDKRKQSKKIAAKRLKDLNNEN